MSRHYIELPSTLGEGTAGVVCGYDRAPLRHFFCNVGLSLRSEHIDEPVWASILDSQHEWVQHVGGFDQKLATMGITLPESLKLALQDDYDENVGNREVWWNGDGTKAAE